MENAKRRKIDNDHIKTFHNLPDEVILNIFKYSTSDIRDYKKIGNVCKRFSVIAEDRRLYTRIRIVNGESCDEIKTILRTYKTYIKALELRDVNLDDLEMVKEDIKNLSNLTLLKLKNLYVDVKGMKFITDVVKSCQNIRKFNTSRLAIINPRGWSEILDIICNREIEEFSFHNNVTTLPPWDINSFLQKNKGILTSLKIPVMYELGIAEMGNCRKLKTLYLDPPLKCHYEFSHRELLHMEQLTNICFHTDHFYLDELCEFFSKPCRMNIKKIQLFIGYDFDRTRLFDIIMNKCRNLEELSVSIGRNGEHFPLSLELIKFILYRFKKLKRLYLSIVDRSDLYEIDRILRIGMCPSLEIFRTITYLPYARKIWPEQTSMDGPFSNIFTQMKQAKWVDYSNKLKLSDELRTLVATKELWNRARISFDRKRVC